MTLSKVFSVITPFMLLSLLGVAWIIDGFRHMGEKGNGLQFYLGGGLIVGALGFHYLIRYLLKQNTLYIWIAEAILVGVFWYNMTYKW